MGRKGPIPNPEGRVGHPSVAKSHPLYEVDVIGYIPGTEELAIPDPPVDEDGLYLWHDNAVGWYTSLSMSGQSRYYQASDWAMAWNAAVVLSAFHDNPWGKGAAQLLVQFNKMASGLLCSLGDRRRVNLEIKAAQGDPDDAAADEEEGRWGDALSGEVIDPGV